jgi:hypothetical protein
VALMAAMVALVLALAFGGADQYLGSLSAHPWATDASLLSAPWLLLAFLAGWTQRSGRRAALLGVACTLSALVGYGLMTLSPIENAQLTLHSGAGFLRSGLGVLGGAVVTGPLFGWFGHRWRSGRAWLGASITAATVLFEPVAHAAVGDAIRLHAVSAIEMAVGLALVFYVAATTARSSRSGRRTLR